MELSADDLLSRYARGERDFRLIDLRGDDLGGANVSGANLSGAKLMGAYLGDANLGGANLSGANLMSACLVNVTLTDADLSGANLDVAELGGATLIESHLAGASLLDANLTGANLTGADLTNANLFNARLVQSNLSDADLSRADLLRAALAGTTLAGTNVARARCGSTVFADVDLRGLVGLDSIQHWGPSSIGIDTLYRSGGDIPEAFLRGCGVPDDFIAYARALVAKPIDYYSCFISYSSKDRAFAERLHADLQGKGVRCWFAPEDLKIGDKFPQRIEESIKVFDKLLIVLSENSVRSEWVEREVHAALEKEGRQKKAVLFPIRLDDSVMEADAAWAADLRRQRHIGDFTKWNDHHAYRKAFDRLLRDLKNSKRDASPAT